LILNLIGLLIIKNTINCN